MWCYAAISILVDFLVPSTERAYYLNRASIRIKNVGVVMNDVRWYRYNALFIVLTMRFVSVRYETSEEWFSII